MVAEDGYVPPITEKEAGPLSPVRYAYERLSMSPQERRTLARKLGVGEVDQDPNKISPVTDEEVLQIVSAARARTEEKLQSLGIVSLEEYDKLFNAFVNVHEGDTNNNLHLATIQTMCRLAAERRESSLRGKQLLTTKEMHTQPDGSGSYTPDRENTHNKIVTAALEKTQPQEQPTLLILGGPPGGGKSSAREKMLEGASIDEGFVIADPDAQRVHLIDPYDPTNQLQVLQTQAEAFYVSDKILAAARDGIPSPDGNPENAVLGMRNVVIEGSMRNGSWLEDQIKEFKKKGYRVEIAWVHKNPEDCLVSATAFRARGVDPALIMTCLRYGYANFRHLSALEEVSRASIFKRTIDDIEIVQNVVDGVVADSNEEAIKTIEERIRPFEEAVSL